jgi:hypothetical protein
MRAAPRFAGLLRDYLLLPLRDSYLSRTSFAVLNPPLTIFIAGDLPPAVVPVHDAPAVTLARAIATLDAPLLIIQYRKGIEVGLKVVLLEEFQSRKGNGGDLRDWSALRLCGTLRDWLCGTLRDCRSLGRAGRLGRS